MTTELHTALVAIAIAAVALFLIVAGRAIHLHQKALEEHRAWMREIRALPGDEFFAQLCKEAFAESERQKETPCPTGAPPSSSSTSTANDATAPTTK